MGTEYFKIAEPVSRLTINEVLTINGAPAFTFIDFSIGATHSGQLTIPTKAASEFIRLFRGDYAGKVTFLGENIGLGFTPAKEFKPDYRTQLISETGEVIYHHTLVGNLNK